MKRVVLFFALVLGLISVNAQTWNKVAGNWEYKYLRIDGTQGTFTPPLDTLPGAAVGSIAIKNDVLYKKGSSAWGPVVGSGGGGSGLDWVNVVSFGADSTGATNSTTAIQNAFNSLGGRKIKSCLLPVWNISYHRQYPCTRHVE
jgi:hypothetical protein